MSASSVWYRSPSSLLNQMRGAMTIFQTEFPAKLFPAVEEVLFRLKISLEIGMAAGRSRETGIEPVPFFLPEMRIFGSGEQGTQAGGNTGLAESPGGRASFNGKGNPEVMEFADPLIIMFI